MELKGVAALVTGGASGLGAATVRVLTAAGAHCTIADRNLPAGQRLAEELGGGTRAIEVDVTDPGSLEAALEAAAGTGPLRVCVACAGIGIAQRTLSRDNTPHDLGSFEQVLAVNLVGTFNLIRLGAQAIARQDPGPDGERGVIVCTASVAAFDGQIGQIAYSASKGGIVGMTLPAARDLSAVGIRVMTIAPGIMDTPLLGLLPAEVREQLGRGVPFPKRLGRPEDYGALVAHICTNGYLNGEVIRLDGALRMPPK